MSFILSSHVIAVLKDSQKAHILTCMLRFIIGFRLALEAVGSYESNRVRWVSLAVASVTRI